VHLVADLAELEVVVRVAQSVWPAEGQAELLRQVGQEGLVVEVGLRLGDEGLDLIERDDELSMDRVPPLPRSARRRSAGSPAFAT
jgi:hypothetical protein